MSQRALHPIYINTGTLEFLASLSLYFLCVCVFVIVIPGGLWIVCVISFQRIFGLIGWQWSCNDLLGCRGDLDF